MRRRSSPETRPRPGPGKKQTANKRAPVKTDGEKRRLHSVSYVTKSRQRKPNLLRQKQKTRYDVTLPPPERPNFVRRGAYEDCEPVSFDDRWQSFLEAKKVNDARVACYLRVYFRRWRLRYSKSYVDKVRERTKLWDESTSHTPTKAEVELADTLELIQLARSKVDSFHYRVSLDPPNSKSKRSRVIPTEQESDSECSIGDTSIPKIDSPPPRRYPRNSDLGDKSLMRSQELQAETEDILNEDSLSDGPDLDAETRKLPVRVDPARMNMSAYTRTGNRNVSLADSVKACAAKRDRPTVSFEKPPRRYNNVGIETSLSAATEESLGLEFNIVNSSEAEDVY